MDIPEISLLLRDLISQYRELHAGKSPLQIYASADVFASLRVEKEPSARLKSNKAGHTFDGVAIELKGGQTLPFILRP
jgi:hypothetical protein